jgi:hypothetical protein
VDTVCNGQPCNQTCCGTQCVDITRDNNNCGFCGHACNASAGEMCVPPTSPGSLAQCQAFCGGQMCLMGQMCCGNACVFTIFDMNNCGRCGNVCTADQFCFNGCCATDPFSCLTDGGLPDAFPPPPSDGGGAPNPG